MSEKHIKRPVVKLNRSNQLELLEEMDLPEPQPENLNNRHRKTSTIEFNDPDPKDIYLGGVRIDRYIKTSGDTSAFVVRKLMEQHDWEIFEQSYSPDGRRAYAPRCMLGLILYGVMHGVTSLRDLERLARLDIGCLWVSGGIQPDHSILGRFIQQHDALLSEDTFDRLTRQVLNTIGNHTDSLAGDGTVVESSASRYRLLKIDATQQMVKQTREAAQANPEEKKLATRAARAEGVHNALQQRRAERKKKGKNADALQISPSDPEAVNQRLKNTKSCAPAYRPSVLANKDRVIIAQAVDGSSETQIVGAMLDKAKQIGPIKEVLYDAGYHSHGVIEATQSRDIELLCPQGRSQGKDWTKQSTKYYPKNRFEYDATQDSYRCPTGKVLTKVTQYKGTEDQRGYIVYGTAACKACAEKDHCTKNKLGRRIKRYAGDAAKDALRLKMEQPEIRKRYAQRQAMVEPVFSVLRLRQGLRRFRRRGLKGVQTEFALHAMAYNLSRVVALVFFIGLTQRMQTIFGTWYKNTVSQITRPLLGARERCVILP